MICTRIGFDATPELLFFSKLSFKYCLYYTITTVELPPNFPEFSGLSTGPELREESNPSPVADALTTSAYAALLVIGEVDEDRSLLLLQLSTNEGTEEPGLAGDALALKDASVAVGVTRDGTAIIQGGAGEGEETIILQGVAENSTETGKRRSVNMLLITSLGMLVLSGTMVAMARGGNYKVVRQNLQARGKANAKEPMPKEQRRLRRRKRKN
jgi:hypothetical protein